MKIISLLGTDIGLHSLALERPVVHVIDYPDGTTNVPGHWSTILPALRLARGRWSG